MRAIAWLRKYSVEAAWVFFAAVNVAAMVALPSWETIPFHFVWISLTIVYGFRVWGPRVTSLILGAVVVATGTSIFVDAFEGIQLWGELFEVPLMSAMFLAMVWHARRRQAAMRAAEELVVRHDRFLHDVSHELRTPVTIARGHLDLHRRQAGDSPGARGGRRRAWTNRAHDLASAAARGGRPAAIPRSRRDRADSFLEEVFVRWSEVAPRAWRLGPLVAGHVRADRGGVARRTRCAARERGEVHGAARLDRSELARPRLRPRDRDRGYGIGVAPDALDRIFDRFARGDDVRSRRREESGWGSRSSTRSRKRTAVRARSRPAGKERCSRCVSPTSSDRRSSMLRRCWMRWDSRPRRGG